MPLWPFWIFQTKFWLHGVLMEGQKFSLNFWEIFCLCHEWAQGSLARSLQSLNLPISTEGARNVISTKAFSRKANAPPVYMGWHQICFSLKYLNLCLKDQQKSCRFGMSWGFLFRVSCPFNIKRSHCYNIWEWCDIWIIFLSSRRVCMCLCMQWKAHHLKHQTRARQDFSHTGNSWTTACSSHHLENSLQSHQSFCKLFLPSFALLLPSQRNFYQTWYRLLICSFMLLHLVTHHENIKESWTDVKTPTNQLHNILN